MSRFWRNSLVVLIGVVLILVSLYHYPLFNPDGALYLNLATLYSKKGVHAVLRRYDWPFYSFCIAWISHITHLSVLHSARLLNGLFSILTVFVFAAVIEELSGSKKMFWLSVFVFFVFHAFNRFYVEIIRDHGYWFFLLLSFYLLLRFVKTKQLRYSVLWSCSLIFATLFRVEGVVFLAMMPFVAFSDVQESWRGRFFAFLKLSALPAFCLLVGSIILYVNHLYFGHILELSHAFDILAAPSSLYLTRLAAFKQQVLPAASSGIGTVFFLALLFNYIFTILGALSFTYAICVGWVWYRRALPAAVNLKRILWAYILINVLITGVFYSQNLFLATRYVTPLVIFLVCYVPFGLKDLYHYVQQRNSKHRWLFLLVVLGICALVVSDLHRFGPSKRYMYDAGIWLKHHVPSDDTVYSNDIRILIISDQVDRFLKNSTGIAPSLPLTSKPWQNDDYAAILQKKDQTVETIQSLVGEQPIKTFCYKRRQSCVLIFKLTR